MESRGGGDGSGARATGETRRECNIIILYVRTAVAASHTPYDSPSSDDYNITIIIVIIVTSSAPEAVIQYVYTHTAYIDGTAVSPSPPIVSTGITSVTTSRIDSVFVVVARPVFAVVLTTGQKIKHRHSVDSDDRRRSETVFASKIDCCY